MALAAGGIFPTGELRQSLNDGFHIAASADAAITQLDPFKLRAELSYSQLGASGHAASVTKIFAVTANVVRVASTTRLRPYVTGGVGLYNTHRPVAPFSGLPTGTTTDLGYNLGAGVSSAGKVALFMEARYHRIFSDREPTHYVPFVLGVRF
jgi:opacity protein-like surface antigen